MVGRRGPSTLERKVDKVLRGLEEIKDDIVMIKNEQAKMKDDIVQLKQDVAVNNKALVAVNLTPAASLVLGVMYFLYTRW